MDWDRTKPSRPGAGRNDPATAAQAQPVTPAGPAQAWPVAGLVMNPVAGPVGRRPDATRTSPLALLRRVPGDTPDHSGQPGLDRDRRGKVPPSEPRGRGAGVEPSGGVGPVPIRRTMADYKAGYDTGYLQIRGRDPAGYPNGLLDGLEELVDDRVIDANTARAIRTNHPIVIAYPPGWDRHFRPRASDREHGEEGYASGRATGFDQGYEDAIAQYGYARKYSAIPAANVQTAAQDNNGFCVYCNAAAIADIDHIEPLKVHWKDQGAMMSMQARSAEANDLRNLVGACANCNRSKGSKRLWNGWNPPAWTTTWWPFGPARVVAGNSPPPYW